MGPPMMPILPAQQMMGPPILPPPIMPFGGQFQGPYGMPGFPMFGQSQFGLFDEANDEPALPDIQAGLPSPGPSRRLNTNVQSG